jgi:biotin carboxyl carrier protein
MDGRHTPPHKRWLLPLMSLIAALLVVVPFLFWHQTWFGRQLSHSDIEQYLHDPKHPRRIQHGLTQVAERMVSGDPAVKALYPRIVELSTHEMPEIRTTVAWTMGQDNTSPAFHHTLIKLLKDPELMVRRNAALSLVRFADSRGRPELIAALRPFTMRAPSDGALSVEVNVGQEVGRGTLVARIVSADGRESEIRSPYAGRVEGIASGGRPDVKAGDGVLSVGPESGQAWEALRALYLIGQPEDLEHVKRFGEDSMEQSSLVRQQAVLTAQAIRTRSARTTTR